jgi:hypothetical protein
MAVKVIPARGDLVYYGWATNWVMRLRIWLRIYSDLPWPLLSSIGGISANTPKNQQLTSCLWSLSHDTV